MSRFWIGNISHDIPESDVLRLFSTVGTVTSIIHCGAYAFVGLESTSDAQAIVDSLNGQQIQDKAVSVEPSQSDSSSEDSAVQVVVADVPAGVTEDALRSFADAFGIYRELRLDSVNSTASIRFTTPSSAKQCAAALRETGIAGQVMHAAVAEHTRRRRQSSRSHDTQGLLADEGGQLPMYVLVPPDQVGAVIGRAGANIRELQSSKRVSAVVLQNDPFDMASRARPLKLVGGSAAIGDAVEFVVNQLSALDNYSNSISIYVADQLVGPLIGKERSVLNSIIEDSGATDIVFSKPHQVSSIPRTVEIFGDAASISKACQLLHARMLELMSSTRMPRMMSNRAAAGSFEPVVEEFMVLIPEVDIPHVIGRAGHVIKSISEASHARLHLDSKSDEYEGFRPLSIVGPADAQFRAFQSVYNIIQEQHHLHTDVRRTIPGPIELTTFIRVPGNSVGRLIGRQGSKIREMRMTSSCHIEVLTDEEPDLRQNMVAVELTGTFPQIYMAQTLIRQVLREV